MLNDNQQAEKLVASQASTVSQPMSAILEMCPADEEESKCFATMRMDPRN
jgi:hypothetical protein